MKHMARFFVLLCITGIFLAGCSSSKKKVQVEDSRAVEQPRATAPAPVQEEDQIGRTSAPTPIASDPLDDPNSILAKRVVYFDFDSSVVKEDFSAIIEAHAGYLADHPEVKVRLEGHADERGTRDYNLGLGERRASAVRQYLLLMGASASQIETISYGEERPAAIGHNENAWALNRRVELVYLRN